MKLPDFAPRLSRTHVVVLALALAGAAGLGVWMLRAQPLPIRTVDAVPPDAFVSVDVDVGGLRKSGALAALFGDRDEQTLTQVCGFDPVDRMTELVFTVPEGGTGEFGVAVQADLTQDELLRCADEIVKAHGGDPTPDITSHGPYAVITPRTTSSTSTKPARSLGFLRGGPILVGQRAWIHSMIDAIDAAREGRAAASEHVKLRARLATAVTPPPAFLVTATAVLERSVRERLKSEMLAEVGAGDDPGTAMMLGVLGMSSGVAGLYERGADVHAVVDLRCEEERECAQVERLIVKVRGEWAKLEPLRAFGLGPVLDHLEVDHHGTTLEVRASAPTADVVRWAKLLTTSKPAPSAAASAVPAPSGSAELPSQTLKVTVPEGVEPGQPFTVHIQSPRPGAPIVGVQTVTATIPSAAPAPSASALRR